ncbi:MAG TPA: DUF2085 domain-containing protein [Thermoanaerobaculia bacterium]|nr:DUF2085 domain-containing protein [Thermoanaerobaculia bacterium]
MTTTARLTAALLALAVGLVPAAALAVTAARVAGAPAWLELPFRLVCHGIDSRSLAIAGVAMPICARCFALYVGGLAGIAAFFALRPRKPLALAWLLVALAPMAIDGLTQATGLRESSNALRVITGALAGSGAILWLLSRIEGSTRRQMAGTA